MVAPDNISEAQRLPSYLEDNLVSRPSERPVLCVCVFLVFRLTLLICESRLAMRRVPQCTS